MTEKTEEQMEKERLAVDDAVQKITKALGS